VCYRVSILPLFLGFSIRIWNCSDGLVFLFFYFYLTIIVSKMIVLDLRNVQFVRQIKRLSGCNSLSHNIININLLWGLGHRDMFQYNLPTPEHVCFTLDLCSCSLVFMILVDSLFVLKFLNPIRPFDTSSHLIWVTYYRRTHYIQSVCVINTITSYLSTTSRHRNVSSKLVNIYHTSFE